MLKDILKKIIDKNKNGSREIKDIIQTSLADGFVDIKGYKDGTLVYHDAGDNVVTDWMRHAIMVMLTGSVFSANGRTIIDNDTSTSEKSKTSAHQVSMPNKNYHIFGVEDSTNKNLDGYLLNGSQYFWSGNDITLKYSQSASRLTNNLYAVFPTKVLFGTGKEYISWENLKSENETENAAWYNSMLELYGNGDETSASNNFNSNISTTSSGGSLKNNCNVYSGSLATNIYSGDAEISRMRTVNDPDASKVLTATSSMSKDYGIVGAVKSIYFDETNDSSMLSEMEADGRLLTPTYRGIGRPCFLYLNTPLEESWDKPEAGIEVSLTKDKNKSYLHRITFSLTLPSQSASNGQIGKFYPYNGFNLKQIGLFNDAKLSYKTTADNEVTNTYPYKNMPCGMMLAKKNITPVLKNADIQLNITWSLTI